MNGWQLSRRDFNRLLVAGGAAQALHAQMLAENYYGHFQTRLHALGMQLHAEPYGDGTLDSVQVAEYLDLPMGEFWARYTYGSKAYSDLAAGAAHTLAKPLAACEAFTGAPLTSRWTGHPYSMKAEGDRMFCLGINHFVFHTFVHQPMQRLIALNKHDDDNVRYVSGTVRYVTALEATAAAPGTRVSLDLGRLNIAARVRINGRAAGSLWKPPNRLDISKLVRGGTNTLEVEVTTLWPNRLIGDEQLPPEDEYDVHGPIKKLPEWFKAGQPKPGARETFSVWHHYGKDDPLLDSGLLGPVSVSYGVDLKL